MLVMRLFWKPNAYLCSQDGHFRSEEDLQSCLRVHQGWGLLGLAFQARHPHQHFAPVKKTHYYCYYLSRLLSLFLLLLKIHTEVTGPEEEQERSKVKSKKGLSGATSEVPGKREEQ